MNHLSLRQNINMKFLKYLITLNLIIFIFLDQKHLIQTNIYYIEKHSVCLYFLYFLNYFYMKDILDREIKIGDFVAYGDPGYAEARV